MAELSVERLWVRTHRGSWIPLPYGADGDNGLVPHVYDGKGEPNPYNPTNSPKKVRSYNFWDGDQWLMPIGREVTTAIPDRSYNLRSPNAYWGNSDYNPGYINDIPPHPAPNGWIQLSEMQPRNDPTWRITAFPDWVPVRPPAIPQRAPGQATMRQPDMVLRTHDYLVDGVPGFSYNGPPGYPDTRYWWPVYSMNSASASFETFYFLQKQLLLTWQISEVPEFANNQVQTIQYAEAANIDLLAMRGWLTTYFAQSNHCVGVYEDLTKMELKRVIISGSFAVDVYAQQRVAATDPPGVPPEFRAAIEQDFLKPTFTVKIRQSGASTSAGVGSDPWVIYPFYNQTRPIDTSYDGTMLFTQTGIPGTTEYPPVAWSPMSRIVDRPFCLIAEAPFEDNLRFSGQITNMPAAGSHTADDDVTLYPSLYQWRLGVFAQVIEFHYALPDSDTEYYQVEFGLGDGSSTVDPDPTPGR